MEKKLTSAKKKENPHKDLIQARKKSMQQLKETSEKSFEWLNENSRKFLAAGYLGDGISAEERIANIAQRAEQLLEMPGFADKFYYYMSQGFYSLASPVWSMLVCVSILRSLRRQITTVYSHAQTVPPLIWTTRVGSGPPG